KKKRGKEKEKKEREKREGGGRGRGGEEKGERRRESETVFQFYCTTSYRILYAFNKLYGLCQTK
ncbi:hypothetical protein, partial [Bacillus mycoides]|uniref:hypothetical protein n=1 Tax=Bacillus mycoides TaxID=1405 RepID=UPI003D1EEA8F